MLKSKELRVKAWNSLKGKYWMAVLVTFVIGILASVGGSFVSTAKDIINILTEVDPAEMDSTMEIGAMVLIGISSAFSLVGLVISLFVGNAAVVGGSNYFIKNTDSKPSFAAAFSGFKVKYGRNIGTLLLVGIKTTLWTCLFIVPGIIKMYEYSIIPYILADDDTITCKEAFKKAKEMMKGNKWRLFKLEFSFIGWALLSALTCGIGAIFLAPYVEAAKAEFYVELKNK